VVKQITFEAVNQNDTLHQKTGQHLPGIT